MTEVRNPKLNLDFDQQSNSNLDKSLLIFLGDNLLDYKTLLFEHLFPLVRSSLLSDDHMLDLLQDVSNTPITINRQNLEMVSNALPLCKRFVAQLNSNRLLRQLFVKVVEELRANNMETAKFFADKLVTLTDHAAIAVYLLGEVFFLSGEYTKVNYLFHKNNLLLVDENFLDLTAKSLLKLNKYEQCLKIAGNSPKITLYNPEGKNNLAFRRTHTQFQSSKFRLMGICYKNLDNRSEAESNLLKSLNLDSSKVPVFQEYLSVREANLEDLSVIIDNLHFSAEHEWLRDYYKLCNTKQSLNTFSKLEYKLDSKTRTQFKVNKSQPFKENKPNIPEISAPQQSLAIEEEGAPEKNNNMNLVLHKLVQQSNTQLLYLKAKALYQNYELQESYKVCKKILTLDSFHFPTLDIYTELLVERKVD